MQRMARILNAIRGCYTSFRDGWTRCTFEARHTVVSAWASILLAVLGIVVSIFGILVAWWMFQVQLSLQITATEIQNRQILDAKRDKQRDEARNAAEAFQLQRIDEPRD